jgi:hypothetical protein
MLNDYMIAKRFPRRYNSWHPVENAPSLGEIYRGIAHAEATIYQLHARYGEFGNSRVVLNELRYLIIKLTALEEKA